MNFGKIMEYKREGSKSVLLYERGKVVLDVITAEIVNVFVPLWAEEHYSKAIEQDPHQPADFTTELENGVFTLSTDQLRLVVQEDFLVDIYRADGTLLCADYRGERRQGETLSHKALRQLEAEGHDISNLGTVNYPVMTVKALEREDCFYGLGDKTGFLNKRGYAYENWNSDLPQAHNEDFRALYKSIPFLMCRKNQGCYGLFFDNTFHSYLNLGKESEDYFYYGAEDGNLDYYVLGGERLVDLIRGYTYLTGRTPLPQLWTLGYQQSRWGYECAEDIREIAMRYRSLRIPCDVIHLDIDYMQDFKVFTWNEKEYGLKGKLCDELCSQGYKPVTIIDPGTKLEPGYFMYEEGVANGYFATDTEGKVYVNEVWPGEANFPDFGRGEVREWWADHHKELLDMGVQGIWNDMNEPASFQGELPPDVVFHDGDRKTNHAEMHNVYGHYMDQATYTGVRRHTGKRPFVITRACYAGTQKYAVVWTGDNQSLWSHLQMLVPQLCNLGMSGFSFCGTDVGGFGADATPELLCRWVEAACFSPLFRNHAAKGTRRQEPWQFDEQTLEINRKYITLRYQFLPYLYDLFYQGMETGLPVMRPLVLHYETDKNTHELNGQFLVGEQLLVAPVLEQGARHKLLYLPEGSWYDYWTGERLEGGQYLLREAELDVCPMYVKAGSIIPMYEPVQYVGEKPYDKLILLVTPEAGGYRHYQDNGTDYSYENGEYNLYEFLKNENGELTTHLLNEGYKKYREIVLRPIGK